MALRYVIAPAGRCPCKPDTTLPEQHMVEEWAFSVHDHGLDHAIDYSAQALWYWGRQFWRDLPDDKLQQYKEFITKLF